MRTKIFRCAVVIAAVLSGALFVGSAKASSACNGPRALGAGVVAKVCVSSGDLSGQPAASSYGTHLKYTDKNVRFLKCKLVTTWVAVHRRTTGQSDCTYNADAAPISGGESDPNEGSSCILNEQVSLTVQVFYRLVGTPKVERHTAALSASTTCTDEL